MGVATETQTPSDLPAMLALASIAACVAKKVVVSVRGNWKEHVGLYVAVALPPGTRKSAVFRAATQRIHEHERALVDEAMEEIREYKCRKKQLVEAKACRDPKVTERVDAELAALGEEPTIPRLIADDVTAEKLAVLLEANGGRMAVLSSEGGIFDMMAGKYSPSNTPNFDIYLKGHCGDPLRVDRIGRDPVIVDEPVLTLALAVQPGVVSGIMRKGGFRERGLLARILYSMPASLVGHRVIRPPPIDPQVAGEYQNVCQRLLDGAETRVLGLDQQADQALLEFERELEPRLGPDGDLMVITDWASKLAGAVVRIAAIIQLAGNAEASNIGGPSIRRAVVIGHYLIAHARAAHLLMGADPAMHAAQVVLKWIRAKRLARFSQRDAQQATKGKLGQVATVASGIRVLLKHGYVRERQKVTEDPGPGHPPGPVFDVNPMAHNPHNSEGCD